MRTFTASLLGARIKAGRNDKGWTQRELARRLHIDPATLSRIESGKQIPDVLEVKRIAKEIDVKPAYLLEDQD